MRRSRNGLKSKRVRRDGYHAKLLLGSCVNRYSPIFVTAWRRAKITIELLGPAPQPMPSVFFITHPDVVIKPSVPIPDWPLNERGRARMHAMVAAPWVKEVRSIFASSERKAREGAQILADGL